jgi:hypothetical protein
MPDFIPRDDESFDTFFTQFNTWVQVNGATRGLNAAQLADLNDRLGDWTTVYPSHLTAQTAANTARELKDSTRAECEAVMRECARVLQNHPNTTDPDRTAAGLTVRDNTRTRAAVPTTAPALTIDNSQRLRQTIHFRDVTTPTSKAKPAGVRSLELRCFCGPTPPADPEAFAWVANDSSTPYVKEFDAGDANKDAWWVGRWENTRGEKGPWSEVVKATVGS